MTDETQVVQIFKTIDATVGLELLVIIVTAIILIVAVQRTLSWVGNRLQGKKRLNLLVMVPFIRLAIILITFVVIVPLLIEPSIQNMVALLGTVAVALGFALKDYVSSLIAGIVAIGERNYRNGDWIRVGDIYGEVCHVGMRTVEVVTPDDDRVLIPHALLWNQAIFNSNNGDARLQCAADFYLHPQHDGIRVKQLLEDVALTSPFLYIDKPIIVIVKEEPWGTHYRLKAYPVDAAQQFRFTSDLTVRGKTMLLKCDVRFAVVPAVSDSE
ncbi:small-conductance mechanosensitive channel [Nitrosomonas aestuarii]|nr:small-conductance mechanosensitive channel [Nitrosomonas aestuarii]